MKPADLDKRLDEACPRCNRDYRWCECGIEAEMDVDPDAISDEEMALDVSAAWMSRGTIYDEATGMRIWAHYRRRQSAAGS